MTGVQTCALPICDELRAVEHGAEHDGQRDGTEHDLEEEGRLHRDAVGTKRVAEVGQPQVVGVARGIGRVHEARLSHSTG